MSDTLKITPFGIQEVKIVELVKETDPILREKSVEWDFNNPPENAIEFAKELIHTCKAYGGLGLSAVQIGKLYRVFCIGLADQFQVCFNPEIIMIESIDKAEMLGTNRKEMEGCLSYPGLVLNVERSSTVRAKFQMPNGEVREETFEGLTARCFQHELDHLNGITFTDRVGEMSLMRAKEKRKKLIRQIAKRHRIPR